MKRQVVFIFTLLLVLTGFKGEDQIVEQRDVNFQERITSSMSAVDLTNPLEDQMVKEGDDAIFTATFSTTISNVAWFKDGNPIKAGEGRYRLFINGKTATLLIKNVIPSDSGEYKVVFGKGEITSCARLFVILSE